MSTTDQREQRPLCADCQQEIDPDWCWCGSDRRHHDTGAAEHGFVPMGCDCYRDRGEPATDGGAGF